MRRIVLLPALLLAACSNSTEVQRRYVDQRDVCRNTAEEFVAKRTPPAAAGKQSDVSARLAAIFSDCMAAHNWTVATPPAQPPGTPPGKPPTPPPPPPPIELERRHPESESPLSGAPKPVIYPPPAAQAPVYAQPQAAPPAPPPSSATVAPAPVPLMEAPQARRRPRENPQ